MPHPSHTAAPPTLTPAWPLPVQVPAERYLFMKLTYTDDTPDEYEPPMFGPAPDGGVGCFSRMPFVMEIGAVDTKHIKASTDHVGAVPGRHSTSLRLWVQASWAGRTHQPPHPATLRLPLCSPADHDVCQVSAGHGGCVVGARRHPRRRRQLQPLPAAHHRRALQHHARRRRRRAGGQGAGWRLS